MAIPIPSDIRESLLTAIDRCRTSGARVTWVRPDNLHLSLAFLGNILGDTAERIASALREISSHVTPIPLTVSRVGTFGRPRCPRVIWAGVDAQPDLQQLQEKVADACRGEGVPIERRPFHPHVTLGRVRNNTGADELAKRVKRLEDLSFGSFEAAGIELMRSDLSPDGARYTSLQQIPFRP